MPLSTTLSSIVEADRSGGSWNFMCLQTASLTAFEERQSLPYPKSQRQSGFGMTTVGQPLATFLAYALMLVTKAFRTNPGEGLVGSASVLKTKHRTRVARSPS